MFLFRNKRLYLWKYKTVFKWIRLSNKIKIMENRYAVTVSERITYDEVSLYHVTLSDEETVE